MFKKILQIASGVVVLALTVVTPVLAQTISVDTVQVGTQIGQISTINQAVIWVINVLRWFGWAGVIIGVMLALFALIYKLFSGDNEEAMKNVQGYLTKAVLIVVIGVILLGAGFIVRTVSGLFGQTLDFNTDVDQVTSGPSQP